MSRFVHLFQLDNLVKEEEEYDGLGLSLPTYQEELAQRLFEDQVAFWIGSDSNGEVGL